MTSFSQSVRDNVARRRIGSTVGESPLTGATTDRSRYLLPVAVLVAVVVVLVGWLLLVSPLRSETAALTDQTATVTGQVDALQSRLSTLRAQQADLPRYQAELQAAQQALPTTSALPAFLRTLQDMGSQTGTTVTALQASEPDGTTVAAGNGVGNVYKVPVTLTVSGTTDGLTAFVKALQETQPRAVLVTAIDETTAEGGTTTLSVSMTAFVAPTAGSAGQGG